MLRFRARNPGITGVCRKCYTFVTLGVGGLCKTSHSNVSWRAKIAGSGSVFFDPFAQSFAEFVRRLKHLAGLCAIDRTDKTASLHQVQDFGGAPVSDRQSSLQHRRRSSSHVGHNRECFIEKRVTFTGEILGAVGLLFTLCDLFIVVRLSLSAMMVSHPL